MNREAILNCVRRHLHESLMECGEARPIGEMVPRIASELRAEGDTPRQFTPVNASIVPMPLVAAFVDGDISAIEEQLIFNAVMVDNSVLAEIIASVRSSQEINSLPPLSSSMAKRLLAIQAIDIPSVAIATSEGQTQVAVAVATSDLSPPSLARRRPVAISIAIFGVLAASILAIVWFGFFTRDARLAEHPSESSDLITTPESVSDKAKEPINRKSSQDIVDVEPIPKSELHKDSVDSQSEIAKSTSKKETVQGDDSAKTVSNTLQPGNSLESIRPSETTHLSNEISGIRWTKISGLVAHRVRNPDQPSLVGESVWASVEPGRREWALAEESQPLEFRTLPMSRAEANLASGGKIVLASDTGIQLNRMTLDVPGRLNLQHGAIALLDIPKGTKMEFCSSGNTIATMRWESIASAVLGQTPAGLQVQISDGEISFDEKPRKNSVFVIDRGNTTEHKDRTGRLPNWVSRPTENLSLPKAILAQIASSDNLGTTLTQLMEAQSQSSDPLNEQKIALIAGWRASILNENLLRQVDLRRPLVRIAALQRVLQTPEWDSRYKPLWSEIEIAVGDEKRALLLRNAFQMASQGVKPNASQVRGIMSFLEAPDLASRAMSDFLLRQFYNGGPKFDPNWSGETNTQGVGLWRRFVAQAAFGVR